MSSLPADHRPSTVQGSFTARPTDSAAWARTAADARAAANDDVAGPNDLRNPLWIIAIGMAFFFGITAAVIALG
jgi:hypothetical protein